MPFSLGGGDTSKFKKKRSNLMGNLIPRGRVGSTRGPRALSLHPAHRDLCGCIKKLGKVTWVMLQRSLLAVILKAKPRLEQREKTKTNCFVPRRPMKASDSECFGLC